MFRRIVICLPLTVFLLTVSFADAQQTGKILRIGLLDNSTASGMAVLVDAFRQEMTKLDRLRERISPWSTGFQKEKLSACLSLRQTWFALRLI
jgi:hypothetical protein